MAQSTLFVTKRNGVGKSVVRKIRREGFIPAVLYGREMKPVSLTVNPIDLKKTGLSYVPLYSCALLQQIEIQAFAR